MAITREQFKAANKRGAASIARGPRIEIGPNGLGLHWPQLDAGLHIPALIEGAFGSRRWMQQIGELGDSAGSAAKPRHLMKMESVAAAPRIMRRHSLRSAGRRLRARRRR
jgi:hypothetical protein